MSHSVERHLEVEPAQYDAQIVHFVPHYVALLESVCEVVDQLVPPDAQVLDLGAGTGSLAQALLRRFPALQLVLLDIDLRMLQQARQRLAPFAGRVTLLEADFCKPFPRAHAAIASLSLHHVHDPDEKIATYRRARAAAPLFITADAFVPESALRQTVMSGWADHLIAHGDTRAQAFARFAQWAHEDRYFSVEQELGFLRAAGFIDVDVWFRAGPVALLVAR